MSIRSTIAFLSGLGALSFALSVHAGPDELKAAAKKPPKDPEQALSLGVSLRRAGMYDDATRVLRGVYPKAKGDVGIKVRLESARSLIAAGKHKPAVAECGTLKALSVPRFETCTAEAHLLWRRASVSLPLAEKALTTNPNDYDALVAKGRSLWMMGQTSEAETAFRDAIKTDGAQHEAHMFLGQLLAVGGKPSAAADSLRKASAAEPDEPEPLLLLGEHLQNGTEAIAALRKAIKIRPKYGAAHARLGAMLFKENSLAEAESSLRTAVSIDTKQADWHAGLAQVLVAKQAWDEALKEAAAALKIVNNHASAKLAEADALAGKGDIDLAIESYEKASAWARTAPDALIHAARASLAGGRPTTARAFADRATQNFGEFGPSWVVLGDVAAATKDKAAAKSAYKKALAAKQGTIDKAAVKKKLTSLK
jgi:tetratricopeptide (TPR) repeat protein